MCIRDRDEGVICNSAFGVAIEQVADLADEQIQQECAKNGKNTTWRFSPGYGDLPLTPQKQIIQVLQTQQAKMCIRDRNKRLFKHKSVF